MYVVNTDGGIPSIYQERIPLYSTMNLWPINTRLSFLREKAIFWVHSDASSFSLELSYVMH